MRNMLRNVLNSVVGNERKYSLEHRLFTTLSLLNGAANIGGGIALLTQGQAALSLLHVATGIAFLVFYFVSRFHQRYHELYWPFVLLMLFFLFVNTLGNAGSQGGAHYYFIPALVIATILSRNLGRTLIVFGIFVGAAIVLAGIEYYRPEWVVQHDSEASRLLDVVQNFAFVQIFTGVLVLVLSGNLNLERGKSDRLLLNVLPRSVAAELKETEKVRPALYADATVLFTDFVGFTGIAERLSPEELIGELDYCFGQFDQIVSRNRLEKIKTIGDSYMAVGGVPHTNTTHPVDAVLCAFEIQDFMRRLQQTRRQENRPFWELRLGIHSGSLIAGVVGRRKFVYDVWGDTVNTASRLESAGVPDRVNISKATYEHIKDLFVCEYRGPVPAKNKGEIDMYFVIRILPELSEDSEGRRPNPKFWKSFRGLSGNPIEGMLPAENAGEATNVGPV